MKKYSIFINPALKDDMYTISFKSWMQDEFGNVTDIKTKVDILTLDKAMEELSKFLNS